MCFHVLSFTSSLLTTLPDKKLSGLLVAFLWWMLHHYVPSASTTTDQVFSACSYMSLLKWWIITNDRTKTGRGQIKGQEKTWKWQCRVLKTVGVVTGRNNKNLYVGHIIYLFFQAMQYHKLGAAHSAHVCGLWFRNSWPGEIIAFSLLVWLAATSYS